MEWLAINKEWIFSGIGVFIIGTIFSIVFKKISSQRSNPQQNITAGTKSNNIQTHGNVTLHVGKDDEK